MNFKPRGQTANQFLTVQVLLAVRLRRANRLFRHDKVAIWDLQMAYDENHDAIVIVDAIYLCGDIAGSWRRATATNSAS